MLNRSAAGPKPLSYACLLLLTFWVGQPAAAAPAAGDATSTFTKDIRPLLVDRCYDCHGDGSKKGGVAFDDAPSDAALAQNVELWSKALKAVRAGLMPPPKRERLTADEIVKLERWVKYDAFGLDPKLPDPGRVTVRRLNRIEYRNTIRDLLGVDYKADEEFPADDSGHGFDNIGDVLTVSPMLLEKYLDAASQIAADAVPDTSRVVADHIVNGKSFRRTTSTTAPTTKPTKPSSDGSLSLSFYDPASATASVKLEQQGSYTAVIELVVKGKYAEKGFDHNRAEVAVSIDGTEVHRKEYGWDQKREVHIEFPESWQGGEHHFEVSLQPLTHDLPHYGEIELQIVSLNVRGPQEREHWVRPKNYARFFGEGADDLKTADQRRDLARKLLRDFAGKAFRHPVDEPTVDRLVTLAESIYGRGDKTFELGVRHAMVAVLASPRFIFREEASQPAATPDERYPLIDEYSLASRLSYFLWSSMPDDELLRLAAVGELRKHQAAQVKRMLADPKADALVKNFMGQWLQARDVENIQIDFRRAGDFAAYKRFLSTDKDRGDTRRAMYEELQRYFAYVVHENRSILELVDSDYAFVNERLASYYGIPGVTGNDVRRVTLPKDSPRGGVLTSGGVMLVTSNPTRTSPVKRGLFVLENVLGTPIPPPPPDIPPLEDASKKFNGGRTPTLRETLELHRSASACVSCHSRMDPLGLAFENFSPVGLWRDKDAGQPIDSTGKLITGEAFKDVRELKHILVTDRKADVYRCISEKLLTYALGRGLEYYDVETVDQIVDKLQKDDGRFDTLLAGVIESSAFQRRRANPDGAGPRPVTATSSADVHHSPGTTR